MQQRWLEMLGMIRVQTHLQLSWQTKGVHQRGTSLIILQLQDQKQQEMLLQIQIHFLIPGVTMLPLLTSKVLFLLQFYSIPPII